MPSLHGDREPAATADAPPEQTAAPDATAPDTTAAPVRHGKPERTRAGAAFNGLIAGALVLILLLVFILENTETVKISYLGASGHMSLGIALLLAAVGGALLVGAFGLVRVMQLRHRVRHGRSR